MFALRARSLTTLLSRNSGRNRSMTPLPRQALRARPCDGWLKQHRRLHSPACVSSMAAIRARHELLESREGEEVRAATFPVSDPRADLGEVQLAVSGVSKHFGGVRAVEDVTLTVRCGELISIIG